MATGIEMVLKSLGLDPNEIKANVERLVNDIRNGLTALNARQETTNERLTRIEIMQTRIAEALNIPVVQPQKQKALTNGHDTTHS